MSTLSDALGGSAAPLTFEHAGRTYTVLPVTQETKTRVERWLRRLAYADLYASRQDMPADQYEHALTLLSVNRHRFTYLGSFYWETVSTDAGVAGLVAILFQTTQADAERLMRERGPDIDAIVSETTLASMPREMADMMRARMLAQRQAQQGGEQGSEEAGAGANPTAAPTPTPTGQG